MKRLSKAFFIMTDILFAVVMCFLVVFIVFAFSAKFSGGVPTFFGHAYVRVMSSSMSKDGMKFKAVQRGDIAILEKLYIKDIEVGDVIAYYSDNHFYRRVATEDVEQKNFRSGGKVYKDSTIIFHEVQKIVVDENGDTWFITKGTNNKSNDPFPVKADHVIGRYIDSPLADFLKFIASSTGIIVIVVVPSAIVCLCLLFSMIDTIDRMIQMKKIAASLPSVSGLIDGEDGEREASVSEDEELSSGPPENDKADAKE